ncbi:rhodanese-like domain-containing protein [Bdellovibrionota bacterium FG-2]
MHDGFCARWVDRSCVSCLYPSPPKNLVLNCTRAGVLGPVVGTIGTLQANLAIELTLARFAPRAFEMAGKLFVFDLKTMALCSFEISKNPTCSVCSILPEQIILCEPPNNPVEISAGELAALLDQGSAGDIAILDVREEWEFDAFHLPGSLLWPIGKLEQGEFPELDPSKEWIVCCAHGVRSARALELLQELSTENKKALKHLRGGLSAFRAIFRSPPADPDCAPD